MLTDGQKRDKVLGCILGQAIGDALGHPVEFNHGFGKAVPDLGKFNQFTDDTQMMSAIAEAILMTPPMKGDYEPFMETLGKKFAEWYVKPLGGSHRAPGGACSSAARRLGQGVRWDDAGGLSAKGNGAAMRSSVIGAAFHNDLTMAWEVGCMSSIPTHNNLESILAAGTVSLLCACGVNGIPFSVAIAQVMYRIEDWEHTVPMYPKQVRIGSGYNDQNPWYCAARFATAYAMGKVVGTEREFYNLNGDDFATVPATAAAIYYNTRCQNFPEVVFKCAANTADADTTTAIAGAIAGSRFGAQFISRDWKERIELSSYFHTLADRIWEFSQTVEAPDTRRRATRI